MKCLTILSILICSLKSHAFVYFLISEADYTARPEKSHITSPSLQTEGFMHCSDRSQVVGSANRHFIGTSNTLLLQLNEATLESPLRYDYSEKHKEYYPHIYGPINVSAVQKIFPMRHNTDGTYLLPEGL